MQVRVLFFGMLKDIVGRAEEKIALEEGSDMGRLYELYAARYPRLADHARSILFSRNQEFVGHGEHLQEGDEVAFLPPVSGGASDDGSGESAASGESTPSVLVAGLTREPIDTRILVEQLKRGQDGAVVVFEGIVRNHSGGRATLYLEYEAYEPMALEKMRQIGDEVRQKFPVDGVGMIHRLGRLEIGEASVVIAISSAHRHPAFEACHYAIDRLKQIVPIWKKEHFADGAVWVEGEHSSCAGSSS
ncbi:MAG: molybdenum cofactor biosynthesis protein MoaE [Acidobacteria bacterium]|nr:molybdenum cofactor biosynthesis protein MoaE [Acidobacteriota bacterium]